MAHSSHANCPKYRVWALVASVVISASTIGGCSNEPPFGQVQGEVTLDGKPVDDGVIRFAPLDGKSPTASALVNSGKFAEKVPVGSHRVEISAPKLPKGITSAKQMKRGTVDEGAALEELIPDRYNSRSELKIDVKRGPNEVKYDLKSK